MKDLSRIRQRAGKLMRDRYRLEKENLAMRDMIKGSLIKHYKKCGSKACVCREGKLHGPYWYLSYKETNKSTLRYIGVKDLVKVSRLATNYKRFQSNLTKINRMNREIGRLMGEIREILLSKRGRKK